MPTSRISSPVLVGRGDERDTLAALLEHALAGSGSAVLVSGEAGVGKSRLVRELAATATERGVTVLAGAAVDFGGGSLPFGAVTEALRPVPALIGQDRLGEVVGAGRADLSRVLPDLRSDEAAAATPADPHAQARLFELVLRLLDAAAAEGGILLVIEDLHWADPSTRELFAFLARNVRGSRTLLIGTYRSDELTRTHPLRPYVATLVSGRHVEHLELARLGRDDVAVQVAAILGHEPASGTVDELYARSLGNPFFTEELLGGRPGAGRLPETLRDTLLVRVEQLDRPARNLVEALAVLGRPADEALLGAMTALAGAALEPAVREAAERHVLVRLGPEDPRWYFRHALVQEAVYEDLLGTERTRIHRRVAEALEQSVSSGASTGLQTELARHYRRGHEPARAIAASARAAREAAARYAFPEALQDWEQVLELWEEIPDAATVVGLDHAAVLAEAAQAASSPWSRSSVTTERTHRRSVSLIRAALDEVDADREPLRAALGYAFLMGELFSAGDAAEAETARLAALELLERAPPSLDHVRVLNIVAYPPLFASRYADVAEAETRALAIATEIGAADEAAVARIPLGIAVSFLGRTEEGEAHLNAALAVARDTGRPEALADAYMALGIVREAAGRFDEAIAIMREGVAALTDRRVERTHATTLRNNMAEALRRIGRWDEALEIIERELSHEGTGWEIGQGNALRGHLLAGRGEHEESADALERAWRNFGPAGTGFIGHYHAARAENALWLGRPGTALEIATSAVAELAPSLDLRWIGELVSLGARAVADRATAPGEDRVARAKDSAALVTILRDAVDRARAIGTIFEREVAGYLATAAAEEARLHGESASSWLTAVATWQDLGQPYPRAYALYRAGEATLVAGEPRPEAARLLREARSIAAHLGALPLRTAIDDLSRRARIALEEAATDRAEQPAAPAPLAGLTAREREVAALLAAGHSDQEIGDALFISAKTASVHVSNIKAKLGVERRVEAALLAARLGGDGGHGDA